MEENELYDRIGETDLNPTYKDGQTYQHTDINQMLGILKTAINENYYDIQRLLNGEKTVGNGEKLDGASLSRYRDEELQADDNKVPSSQQAKAYMDALFAGYSAPVRGVDYWTEADQQQIVSDTANSVISEITPDLEEALAAKANINDIPTKISDLQNDSDFLSENNLQMVNTTNIQNGTQLTDATGYARLNKIYGDTSQNGTPTPDNPIDINVVTGDVDITVSNSDNSISQPFQISLGNIELCKKGSYQDYIYYENGNWYIYKYINKIIIDENSNITSATVSGSVLTTRFRLTVDLAGADVPSKYCNRFPIRTSTNHTDTEYIYNATNSPYIYININISRLSENNVDGFKEWLQTNPIEFYYVISTPIIEEITDSALLSQLNLIRNIIFFENETNFLITADELLPTLNFTYAITNRDIYSKEEVNDIVNNVNKKFDYFLDLPVKFIFPKFWENARSGDIELIKYNDINILIDCYRSADWLNVKAMLDDNEASHIDYFILTHYHGDHEGNFENLVNNGYIDSETVLFLPPELITFGIDSKIAQYKAFCLEHNLTYNTPYDYQTVKIDDYFKFTFANCDVDTIEATYTGSYKNLNSASMVILFEHKNIKALFTADAQLKTLQYLYDTKFALTKLDLYKVEHHAINTDTYVQYINAINPTYSVITDGIVDFSMNNESQCATVSILSDMNSNIFRTCNQDDYLIFGSNGNTLKVINGKQSDFSPSGDSKGIYVDSTVSYDAIQDGSQSHPYRDLTSAIASIPNNSKISYTFYLADGLYGYSQTDAAYGHQKNRITIKCGSRIVLQGNSNDNTKVMINGFTINNSNVIINDITIDNRYQECLNIFNSRVQTNNIKIINPDNEISTRSGVILRTGSSCYMVNTYFDYCNACINVREGSSLTLENTTYGSHNNYIINEKNGHITEHNYPTFEDTTQRYDNMNMYVNYRVPILIYDGSNADSSYTDTEIEIPVNFNKFAMLDIQVITKTDNRLSTIRVVRPTNNDTFDLFAEYKLGSDIISVGSRAKIANNNTIEYGNPFKIVKSVLNNTETIDYTNRNIKIRYIYGYLTTTVNLTV